jgi:hypothetical protein
MKRRTVSKTIKIRNVAIGNSIITLLYAFRTNTPCILEKPQRPFHLSKELDDYDFTELKTSDPIEIWDRLCVVLGMSGLLLFPNNIATVRDEGGCLEVITKNNRKTIIEYESVIRFDTEEDEYVNVYDYFWCRAGGAHDVSIIEDRENDFVNKILFPPRNSQVRDAIACSRMPSKDLFELDVSPNMARLKTISMMRNGGLKGLKNGHTSSGEQNWVPPRLEWDKREVKYIYYSDMSLKEVFELEQERGYAWKLLENITHYIST